MRRSTLSGAEHLLVGHDADVGVELADGLRRRLRLLHAHAVGAVDDLALQVGGVHDVEVDDADGAHAGGGQVEHGRRAQSAGADEEHLEPSSLAWPAAPTSGMSRWRE